MSASKRVLMSAIVDLSEKSLVWYFSDTVGHMWLRFVRLLY